MSWIEKLHATYEANTAAIGKGDIPLLPICHSTQKADITIILDESGNFRRAMVIDKRDSRTIIPTTEASAGRVGTKPPPHPLCDKLQYIAADYVAYGGNKPHFHDEYKALIGVWAGVAADNTKLQSVFHYINKGTVIADLVAHNILYCDAERRLLPLWTKDASPPDIFIRLPGGENKPWQADAFVRFSVEIPGEPQADLWPDPAMWESWIDFCSTRENPSGMCFITGLVAPLAIQHPSKIRNDGDKAKLISSNDTSGFTFRGRFTSSEEACSVGFDVTQKAHNALRWLIAKQGRRDGDLAIVAWAISGAALPDIACSTWDLLADELGLAGEQSPTQSPPHSEYTAQEIGVALAKQIGGYSADLGNTTDVVVMELDSATPGRLSIGYYKELTGSEFLQRIQAWHDLENGCVWRQYFGKDKIFVGAPAPREIAETAFGKRLDDKLRKATVKRLLPCIIDRQPIPDDLVQACVRRASSQNGIDPWEWEKALGIACAIYKYSQEENLTMALDENRTTRDYLYGRLLAAADGLEQWALQEANEKRQTNAMRFMQRFSERPYDTWKNIELSLVPYRARLGKDRASKYDSVIQQVMTMFIANDYTNSAPLSGEFLLGFHCQRAALFPPKAERETTEVKDNIL